MRRSAFEILEAFKSYSGGMRVIVIVENPEYFVISNLETIYLMTKTISSRSTNNIRHYSTNSFKL